MTPEIRKFLKDLLKDAGQKDLGDKLEEQMINDLNTRLEDRLILTAIDNLTQEQQNEFGRMAENKEDPGKLQAYLQKNIPDYNNVFARALEGFRETYLGAQL
jgi:hypothetical protein